MSLEPTHRSIRPYAGRDDAFAAAMERAERAAVHCDADDPEAHVGRTRLGYIERRNGTRFMRGPALDRAAFEVLPLID